jgi:prepilin-type N-terminal cleavage/methylation domain-containing protein/prepilin-type processing-associated H-X9-DG protein
MFHVALKPGGCGSRREPRLPMPRRDCAGCRKGPAAFTLVEMLVAIAAMALLAGLLVPAVQMAREAARRSRCQNNLRQMGFALAGYESANGRLPAGRDAMNRWHHSWATAILPQLEQAALFHQYDYRRAWNDPANEGVTSANLAVFRCPSAIGKWDGKTDYGGNYGSALTGLTPGFQEGRAWEAGMFPPIHVPLPGRYRSSPVRMGEVTDGTSQTFLILEDTDRPAKEGGMWANGHNCFAHDNGPVNRSISKEIFSRHPGGAQGLLADGSVRFLSESMAISVVGALCTRAAGEVVAP